MPEDSSVLFNMYKDKGIPDNKKIRYDWIDVYKLKVLSDKIYDMNKNYIEIEDRASEIYRRSVEKEIKKYGEKSDYILTQYYVSFDVKGSRFITMDMLEQFNIFRGGRITDTLNVLNDKTQGIATFKIGALDPALDDDYAFLTIGTVVVDLIERVVLEIKPRNFYILNEDEDVISPETLIERTGRKCAEYELDMIILDSSAAQADRAYYLYKWLAKNNINTMVIPYAYGNQNKQKMMAYLEDSIYSSRLSLPDLDEAKHHKTFNELIEELLYLQKTYTASKIIYKAPEGRQFFDD